MTWTLCPSPIVADVIRWKEPIWAPPAGKRGKPAAIGEQMITAETIALGNYLQLHVLAVEQLSLKDGYERKYETKVIKVKVGDNIKRKKSTIERGDCHRLLWSDETARAAVKK